jgi:formylglycine-generating enzyme
MNRVKLAICLVTACVMVTTNTALADTFGTGSNQFNIDLVNIGNAGNAADPYTGSKYGVVGYNYRIGKYEVTNAQWNAFTAIAGAPTGNSFIDVFGYSVNPYDQSASFTGAQQPTNNVSWYEAAQFCNYLTSGNKSLGAYQLGADGSITVNRAAAIATYGMVYVIPTENEWYKAAYFKPDGSGYSLYANGTSTIPPADNGWNYSGGTYSTPWNVGTGTQEQNGTFDIMGNIWEWNETLLPYYSYRGLRGGSYYGKDTAIALASSDPTYNNTFPANEWDSIGFRIASIPEPATLLLLGVGGMIMRKRRR